MMPCARQAVNIMDAMEESYRQFRETLLEMKSPAPAEPHAIDAFPNPYDGDWEEVWPEELFLDGSDDDSGLEPHRR